eukprot:TRINITY_DN6547_c0_g1_i5.p2 TRINITY_DN6547_c0_g1~~TRINITY_DN6547_c0_g1_i5.p2  ORF type:complete len:113 (+),score=4.99 TRINITY_DN6547_c0_g1_i5:71-409(+)
MCIRDRYMGTVLLSDDGKFGEFAGGSFVCKIFKFGVCESSYLVHAAAQGALRGVCRQRYFIPNYVQRLVVIQSMRILQPGEGIDVETKENRGEYTCEEVGLLGECLSSSGYG